MSSSNTVPDSGITGGAPGNTTEPPPFPGVPISEHAAYLARVHIGVTATLMLLCVIAFGTRMYQRIRPVWKVGLDDGFIVAGFVSLQPFKPTIHPSLTPYPLPFRSSPSPTGPCSSR